MNVLRKVKERFPQHHNIRLSGLEAKPEKKQGKVYNFPLHQEVSASNHTKVNVSLNPTTSFGSNPYGNQLDYVLPKHLDVLDKLYLKVVFTETGTSNTVTPNPIQYILEKLEVYIGNKLVQLKYDNQMFIESCLFNTQSELETRMADIGLDASNNDFSIGSAISASASGTYYLDLDTILTRQGICIKAVQEDIRLRFTWCASASKMTFAGSGTLGFTSADLFAVQRVLPDEELSVLKRQYQTGYDVRYLNSMVQTKSVTSVDNVIDTQQLSSINHVVPFLINSCRPSAPTGSTLATWLNQEKAFMTNESNENLHGGVQLLCSDIRSGFLYPDFVKSKFLLNIDGVYPLQWCENVRDALSGKFSGGMSLKNPYINVEGTATETVFQEVYVYYYDHVTFKSGRISHC